MGNDTMDIEELATYLHRDVREVTKLATRGHLPGRRVGGQWRFATAEVNRWLETQMPSYSEGQLSNLEKSRQQDQPQLLLTPLISELTTGVPMKAKTRSAVLRELVGLAEQSGQVFDPDAILAAIREREDQESTALACGVALPHPHRPLPSALGEHVLAVGRTGSGIFFGGPLDGLTDIFFLICCKDDRTHLQILARLSRLLLRRDFVEALRAAESAAQLARTIEDAERALIGVD